jgi:phosphate transport system permease protein
MLGDKIFKYATAFVAALSILILTFMVLELFRNSMPVLSLKFIFGVNWNPVVGMEEYGVLPYILGTLVTSAIAIAVGVPISLGIAIYLSEMAPDFVRKPLSYIIELLAAVPSVIYGLWGMFVFRFWVKDFIEEPLSKYLGFIPIFQGQPFGLDIFTAGLVLAVMIIPTVSSVSREVLTAVPNTLREAAYSIGATKWEVIKLGVLSYAKSGIFGATILGLGRAVGETMAVSMVIGNAIGEAAIPTSLFKAGQTMASLIANEFNEADPISLHAKALIGVGLILFLFALAVNLIAQIMIWRSIKTRGEMVE